MYACMHVCTYYYFLLNTDDIKYTIKTYQDFKFMYVCMYVCIANIWYVCTSMASQDKTVGDNSVLAVLMQLYR